jgi:hypothetical protein
MLESENFTDRLDTLTLLRFLRARKFDVAAAKTMFVDTEKWRKETKLDEILPTWEYPERDQVAEYYTQFYHKTDKSGRPVYVEQLGAIDLTKLYEITTPERMLTNLAVEYERMADPFLPACSRKSGHLIETGCTIMDLKGVALTRIPQVYSYVRQASVVSQNYYPERLGQLFLINAPWGFSTVWSVVKGWLDPVTVKKIHILGTGYKSELLKEIAEEDLPTIFGGKCECPGGCKNSDAGPWHDKEFVRPAKWQKAAAATDNTISNTGGEVVTPAAPPVGGAAPPVAGETKQDAAL